MKKKVINRIIYGGVMSIVSLSCILTSLICSYAHKEYLSGFGVGLLSVSIFMIVKNIMVLNNPSKLKQTEVLENDERIIKIINNSYALTFRITIFIEAIIAIIAAISGGFSISTIIGEIIGLQLIIFLITYIIISRKI